MDVFYEESAINANASKNEKRYKILNVGAGIFMVIAIFCSIVAFFSIPVNNFTPEAFSFLIFWGMNAGFFWIAWLILAKIKKRINVSYDYTFVSGELRITKVFNVNKRKKVDVIYCDEILQMGDVDNPSYERFRSAPGTKEIVCTSNNEAAEGKFFMYLLVGGAQMKYLYILECRELLLMQLLKFTRRSVLESDYVMQEKKQKKTTV